MATAFIDEPIKHVPLSDQRKAEYFAIMRRGNPILKKYKDRLGTRMSMREFRSRLFRPGPATAPAVPAFDQAIAHRAGPEDARLAKACLMTSLVHDLDPESLFLAARRRGVGAAQLPDLDVVALVKMAMDDRSEPTTDRITPKSLGMSDAEWQAVKAVNDIEWPMTQGYMKLVYRLRHKLTYLGKMGRQTGQMIDADDLFQAGVMAIQDAIYSFDPSRNSSANGDSTKFLTYLWGAVFRRMVRELSLASDVAARAVGHEKLLAVYYKSLISDPENDGFDEVVARARYKGKDGKERLLTKTEVDILRGIFTHFVRDSEMMDADGEGDYGIDQVPDALAGIDHDALELAELMDRAQLTAAERDLLDMALSGDRRFRVQWAKKHGVTRAAAGQLLKRLYSRLAAQPVGTRKRRKGAA